MDDSPKKTKKQNFQETKFHKESRPETSKPDWRFGHKKLKFLQFRSKVDNSKFINSLFRPSDFATGQLLLYEKFSVENFLKTVLLKALKSG